MYTNHFEEGLRVDILCTQLHYICFTGILDVVCWVVAGCYNDRGTKTVENYRSSTSAVYVSVQINFRFQRTVVTCKSIP